MSQQTLEIGDAVIDTPSPSNGRTGDALRHHDIALALSQMTFAERIRAYELGVCSRRELCAAAGREPERMPMLDGEFEWIAAFSADLD
jgi:hypothetical protein